MENQELKKRSTLFSFNNNEGLLERLINKILYLNKYKKYQVKIGLAEIRNEAVKDLIYNKSGLKGIDEMECVEVNIKNIEGAIKFNKRRKFYECYTRKRI